MTWADADRIPATFVAEDCPHPETEEQDLTWGDQVIGTVQQCTYCGAELRRPDPEEEGP